MNSELSGGATHFLLAHLSVKSTSWVLRREFPIAPSFRPSAFKLHYTELDSASRAAIRDHLKHINGGEESMVGVNWVLDSCWRLNDVDEWFSFAIVMLCCPVARALRKGTIVVPDPRPRVLYHLTTNPDLPATYILEYSMPVSSSFEPAAFPSTGSSSSTSSLSIDYDICDPGGRRAIQNLVDQANSGATDLLKKPWGLCSISRVLPKFRRNHMTSAEREKEKKSGLAVVLEWQPGPVETLALDQALHLGPIPMSGLINGASLVDRLGLALTHSHSPDPTNSLLYVLPIVKENGLMTLKATSAHPRTPQELEEQEERRRWVSNNLLKFSMVRRAYAYSQ